jgi:hypothetical protein
VTPSRSIRRSRFGIVPGCDFRRIEHLEMNPQRGRRGENLSRARSGEIVAEILAEADAKKLDAGGLSSAVVGVGIADED